MRPAALLIAVLLLWSHAPSLTAQATARLYAIGDIHGSIDGFKSILKASGLADGNGRWTGGRSTPFVSSPWTPSRRWATVTPARR